MPNYAPRLRLSYVELLPVFSLWAQSCENMVVYEHDADEEVATTHCHVLMINSKYATAEQYKRQFYEVLTEEKRKGNDLWAWIHKEYPNPDISYITYMSNGNLKPKFVQSISDDVIQKYTKLWVNKKYEKKEKSSSEFTQLLEDYEKLYSAKKVVCDMAIIKQWIKSRYLAKRKAVPRGSDTNRYAYSIYAIVMGLDVDTADRHAMTAGIDIN